MQLTEFYSKMDELHNHLNRLWVYFENITDEINSNTSTSNANSAIKCKRKYTGLRGQPKLEVSKRQMEYLRELCFSVYLLGASKKK